MPELLLKGEVYAIVGAAMAVHNEFGAGFAEAVYQESMQIELALRGVPFECQKLVSISYRGHTLRKQYIIDLLCFAQVIVEIKAQRELSPRDDAQLNFGDPDRLDWKRFVL